MTKLRLQNKYSFQNISCSSQIFNEICSQGFRSLPQVTVTGSVEAKQAVSGIQFSLGSAGSSVFSEPLDSLSILPDALPVPAILSIDALSVLFAILPPAFVLLAVIPRVDAVAVLPVILVVAFVHTAVLPRVDTLAVHIIFFPLTVVLSAVGPDVDAPAIDLVLVPLALVHGAVIPDILAMTVLHAFLVAALVATAILPALHALSVLQVILPVALVLRAIDVDVDAVSVGLVVLPFALVDVSIGMPELATAVSFVFAPLALVLGVVGPHLDARAVPHVVLEIAFVDRAILKGQLLNECEALIGGLLLEVLQVLILGFEEVRRLTIRLWHKLLLGRDTLSVVLGESAVPVVVALLLPIVVDFVLDFDLAVLFSGINASASITHFFEIDF